MKGATGSSKPLLNAVLSDAEAVARAREGDHEAFRVLVERYQDRVYRLACRVLRDDELARDAVQEAFLKVYGSLRRFEGRSSFYTWMYRLVFNLCLDLRRRDKSSRHVSWEDDREPEPGADWDASALASAGPGRELERGELRAQLAEAIGALPELPRQTLLLREVDGLSYAEIAETLGIPKGTVMSRLHNARQRLQQHLRRLGVSPGADEADEADGEAEGSA